MNPKVADLAQAELRQIIIAALREVLYTAFDKLDEGDVLLSEFIQRLATHTEEPYPAGEPVLRERAPVAYADPRIAPSASAPLRVGDMTAEALHAFVAAVVAEALPEMLADPDWGLELDEEFAAGLTESIMAEAAGHVETLSADEVRERSPS